MGTTEGIQVEITSVDVEVPEVVDVEWRIVHLPDHGDDVGVLVEVRAVAEQGAEPVSHWFALTGDQSAVVARHLDQAASSVERVHRGRDVLARHSLSTSALGGDSGNVD